MPAGWAALGGAVVSAGAGYMASQSAEDAATAQAEGYKQLSDQQYQRAQEAAGKVPEFKPVTVTSSFGTPQYTYDSSGRLTGISSQAAPWLANLQTQGQGYAGQYMGLQGQALQDKRLFDYATQSYGAGQNVMGLAGQAAGQAQGLYDIGQEMYGLSRGLAPTAQQFGATGQALQGTGADIYTKAAQALPTSYDTEQATQDYYDRMQQLVAPQREQQLAQTRLGLFNKGRQGLATGATQAGGMLASNPEMAAYYNAIAQQDLNLANQAEQQSLSNLAQRTSMGQGLYNTGLQQYQAGLGAQQQGVGTTSSMANILGQGIAGTQAGTGALSSAASLYNQGTGLFGAGAGLQNQYYTNLVASQAPLTGQMAQLGAFEQQQYSPVTMGMQYGGLTTDQANKIAAAYMQAAGAGADWAAQGLNAQFKADSQNPWAALAGGIGSGLQSYGASQAAGQRNDKLIAALASNKSSGG